jgi:hypothetical protein
MKKIVAILQTDSSNGIEPEVSSRKRLIQVYPRRFASIVLAGAVNSAAVQWVLDASGL